MKFLISVEIWTINPSTVSKKVVKISKLLSSMRSLNHKFSSNLSPYAGWSMLNIMITCYLNSLNLPKVMIFLKNIEESLESEKLYQLKLKLHSNKLLMLVSSTNASISSNNMNFHNSDSKEHGFSPILLQAQQNKHKSSLIRAVLKWWSNF